MENGTIHIENHTHSTRSISNDLFIVEMFVTLLIMVFSVFGNLLIIASILKIKMSRSFSNVLIMNLAWCDVVLVITSIPIELYIEHRGYFSLGTLGCKLIDPISTYSLNAISITLMLISLERFLAIVYSFNSIIFNKYCITVVLIIHIVSLVIVIPFIITSDVGMKQGVKYCGEKWNDSSRQIYTVFLFLVQFGIPLIFMIVTYSIAWRVIQKTNSKTIKVLDRLLPVAMSIGVNNNNQKTKKPISRSISRKFSTSFRRKKSRSMSETSIARHKQTIQTLKMFTGVVIVFAVCMMPNQITWFYLSFNPRPLSRVLEKSFYWMTYANAVLNPWIYAGFNPRFRKAYKHLLKKLFTICLKTNSERFTRNENIYRDRKLPVTYNIERRFSDPFLPTTTPDVLQKPRTQTCNTDVLP